MRFPERLRIFPPPLRRILPGPIAAAAVLLLAAACGRSTPDFEIRLVEDREHPGGSYVEVVGIGRGTRTKARGLTAMSADWADIFTVRVVTAEGGANPTPIAGKYELTGNALRFTPQFPFDPGRQYHVWYFGADHSPGTRAEMIQKSVALPARAPSAPTRVAQVFPSGDVLPENQLRLYIHFSAPMGRRGGLDHLKLLDQNGREVTDPFLPLEAEFWNADRTRYTVFFDPGRQKRGILPNREMGPSLVAGHRYTLVVDRAWIDGNGNPLAETFTRTFRVGPPHLRPIDYARWRVTPPAPGTRQPLSVEFPEALDHGLLQRAIGVRRDGRSVTGDIRIDAHETRWTLTPSDSWEPGRYELVALSILEDLAGNRIGRAFEVQTFERVDADPEPAITRIPFSLAPNSPQ